MMRAIGLVLWLVAGVAPAAAEAPAAPASPAPFLWEIEGPAARHYLLGAVHLLPATTRPLPPALDAAYASSRVLVVETELDALATPAMQGRMLGAAREDRPGGLEGRIGKKLYRRLQVRAAALGMPTPVCAELRAWFCALALQLHPLQQAGFSVEFGIDQHYYARAREDGRAVVALETPEFQLDLFIGMSEGMSKQMLAATLDEAGYESQSPAELLRVWRSGDVGALEEMLRDMRRRYPELYARILAERNRAWVAPLVERMRQGEPLLVVVGAAHLPGPDGLIALLKARGIEAKPVTATMETLPAAPVAVSPE
jgi:hypothetical protein